MIKTSTITLSLKVNIKLCLKDAMMQHSPLFLFHEGNIITMKETNILKLETLIMLANILCFSAIARAN